MTTEVPPGFRLAGVHCGIKRNPMREDLTLVVSDRPAVAAGVYTQNLVFAAPVALDRARTPSDWYSRRRDQLRQCQRLHRRAGLADARGMAGLAAATCGARGEQALVMSTGVIGEFLPMDEDRRRHRRRRRATRRGRRLRSSPPPAA